MELRQSGGTATGKTQAHTWAQRITQGRHWKWGESLTPKQLERYAELMAQTGPRSGSFLDVIEGLMDVSKQNNQQKARDLIKEVAMGLDPQAQNNPTPSKKRTP